MTDDPSQVDTATLIRSTQRDVEEAFRWLAQARIGLLELQRRSSSVHRETSTD